MSIYSLEMWIFLFFIYSFFGWIWETCYVSIKEKKLANRGFLYSPILPIYGFGAVIVLISTLSVKDNLYLVYIFGALGATLLEVVTGYAMEVLFKTRYWDYSNQKFNYKGYICLSSTIAWGFFSIIMLKYINVPIENFVYSINSTVLNSLVLILLIIFTVDMTKSIQNALDLKKLLETMANNNDKIKSIIDDIETMSTNFNEGKEDLLEHIESIGKDIVTYEQNFVSKLTSNKDLSLNPSNLSTNIANYINKLEHKLMKLEHKKREKLEGEFNNLKLKIEDSQTNIFHINLQHFKGAISQLKRNPKAVSKNLKEELEKIKKL